MLIMKKLLTVCVLLFVVGCTETPDQIKQRNQENLRREEMIKHPKVTDIAVVEGCKIKYVETYKKSSDVNSWFYYQYVDLYLTDCSGVETTTEHRQVGKGTQTFVNVKK